MVEFSEGKSSLFKRNVVRKYSFICFFEDDHFVKDTDRNDKSMMIFAFCVIYIHKNKVLKWFTVTQSDV